jgi:hypothetical protein
MIPGGPGARSRGTTIGKTISKCVYIEKKIFSRTNRPISIKHDTNHHWVKGILTCSSHLQMGDNHKNATIW